VHRDQLVEAISAVARALGAADFEHAAAGLTAVIERDRASVGHQGLRRLRQVMNTMIATVRGINTSGKMSRQSVSGRSIVGTAHRRLF
jgi:hypothetical protein